MGHLHKHANGHLLKTTNGHLVNFCGPCINCQGSQPNAVITITGPLCQNVAGTYVWGSYSSHAAFCGWTWYQSSGTHELSVLAQHWRAALYEVSIDEVGFQHFYDGDPTELNCVNGSIEGTIVVDGVLSCAGDTATITFG